MAKEGFRPDIEGLRAVAILAVLLYHAQVPWASGGFIGVDVFFVLSGFLITRSLVSEVDRTGTFKVAEFYARRVRRLLPASALVLVATAAGVWAALPSTMWRTFGGDVAAAAAYFVNWRLAARSVDYLAQDLVPSPVQHFWSLSVEEQFYVVWPLLMLVGVLVWRKVGGDHRRVLGWLLATVVLVPSFVWAMVVSFTDPASGFFLTNTRLWEMAVGALLAVGRTGVLAARRGLLVAVKVAALVAIAGTVVLVDGSIPWPGPWTLVPILATAALILAGGLGSDPVERVLGVAPMQRIGAWSYSLYLWHWPPLAILGARWGGLSVPAALLITVASFVPAVLAYRWVESPFRVAPQLRASAPLSLSTGLSLTLGSVVIGLVVMVAVPMTVAPSFAPGAEAIAGAGGPEELLPAPGGVGTIVPSPALALHDRPTISDDGCQVDQSDPVPVFCERGDPSGTRTVMVVGDSKMGQWEPALDEIGRTRGWKIVVATKSACELSMEMPNLGDKPYPSCLDWSAAVLEAISSQPPDVVLVSQGSASAWAGEDDPTNVDLVVEGMVSAYEVIIATGAYVVVLFDNPQPPFVVRDCVADRNEDLYDCAFTLGPRTGSGGRTAQTTAAARLGLDVVDMVDMICPFDTCLPVIGGVLVYRDGSHITATYVRSMAGVLEERLVPLVERPTG